MRALCVTFIALVAAVSRCRSRRITLACVRRQDLFSLQCVTDPQIRPDGHVIAYVFGVS